MSNRTQFEGPWLWLYCSLSSYISSKEHLENNLFYLHWLFKRKTEKKTE